MRPLPTLITRLWSHLIRGSSNQTIQLDSTSKVSRNCSLPAQNERHLPISTGSFGSPRLSDSHQPEKRLTKTDNRTHPYTTRPVRPWWRPFQFPRTVHSANKQNPKRPLDVHRLFRLTFNSKCSNGIFDGHCNGRPLCVTVHQPLRFAFDQ